MDRSARSLFSVSALVIAVLLVMNYSVQQSPIGDWWPVLVLAAVVLLVWAWGRYSDRTAEAAPASPEYVPPLAPVIAAPVAPPPAPKVAPPPAPEPATKAVAPPAPVVEAPPAPAPVVQAAPPPPPPAPEPAAKAVPPPEPVVEAPPVVQAAPPPPEPAPKAAPSAPKAAGKPDDLTVIEGIGPKMSAALIAAGIDTYVKLSQTSEADLLAAVEAAGMRLAPTLPTWPEQATYAVKGDWDGLKTLQLSIKGTRKTKK